MQCADSTGTIDAKGTRVTTNFRIAGTSESPQLTFRVNPTYALYHWLRANAGRSGMTDERLKPALNLARRSLDRPGPRGMIAPWEEALAAANSPDQSLQAFQDRIQKTGVDMVTAMRSAERIFLDEHWPEREERIGKALAAIRDAFAPVFPAMSAKHAALLDLDWPLTMDAYMVGDMTGNQGAYSHPFTIEIRRLSDLALFETIIHEATHVAEVNGRMRGHRSLGDRLLAYLDERGLSPDQRFNVWHAVIFAASAASIRAHVNLDHEDYAAPRNLYPHFGTPHVAEAWREYAETRDEARLRQALLDDFQASRRT
jgi:hypothetical protein